MDTDWDNALRLALKQFKARTRRSVSKQQELSTSAAPVDAKPLTWDEALRRQLRRARRIAAKAPKSIAAPSQVGGDG